MTWEPGESIFNLPGLAAELELADPQPNSCNDGLERRVFLGTVMSLTPSGKYYTPFACGNVTPCPTCEGDGLEVSTLYSELYAEELERLHAKAKEVDGGLRQIAIREYGPACEGKWPDAIHVVLRATQEAVRALEPKFPCGECDGVGSVEAMLDEKWREQAEQELDEIGAYLDSGEGDPCDLFAVKSLTDDELMTLLRDTEDGDECPLCQSGTVEHVDGEVKCTGECGNVAELKPKPEAVCENCGKPAEYDSEVCLCPECEKEA